MSAYDFKHEFMWEFPLGEQRCKSLQSSSFYCIKPGSLDKFCLEIDFKCTPFEQKWMLSLKAVSVAKLTDLYVSCCLTIENVEGEIWYEHASELGKRVAMKTLLMSKDFKEYFKNKVGDVFLWPDNKRVLKGTLYFLDKNADSVSPVNHEHLQVDMRKLYKDCVSYDVTFCLGEERLHAHKAILCFRSPVFDKMFNRELESGNVIIEDVDIEVFDCFLQFLYTGEIENLALDNVRSLCTLADRYDVESLRTACWQTLGRALNVDSACSVLLFAEENNCIQLKETAKAFIRKRFDQVARTSDWARIIVGKPELAREV